MADLRKTAHALLCDLLGAHPLDIDPPDIVFANLRKRQVDKIELALSAERESALKDRSLPASAEILRRLVAAVDATRLASPTLAQDKELDDALDAAREVLR